MSRQGEFSASAKREMWDRSGRICECHRVPQLMAILHGNPCNTRLGPVGNIFYEHIVCKELDGDDTPDNGAVLTRTCWKLKTSLYDIPAIAKAKRLGDADRGIVVSSRCPLPGGRQDTRKRTMSGQVVDRRTGERYGTRTPK